MAVSYNWRLKVVTLYVNGQAVTSCSGITWGPRSVGQTTMSYVGRSVAATSGTSLYLDGRIRDLVVWNRTLRLARK